MLNKTKYLNKSMLDSVSFSDLSISFDFVKIVVSGRFRTRSKTISHGLTVYTELF